MSKREAPAAPDTSAKRPRVEEVVPDDDAPAEPAQSAADAVATVRADPHSAEVLAAALRQLGAVPSMAEHMATSILEGLDDLVWDDEDEDDEEDDDDDDGDGGGGDEPSGSSLESASSSPKMDDDDDDDE